MKYVIILIGAINKQTNREDNMTKKDKLKKYRVFKEFFVDAHDEYEAETKAEDKKIKLPYNLIDVHEIDEDDEFYKEANREDK